MTTMTDAYVPVPRMHPHYRRIDFAGGGPLPIAWRRIGRVTICQVRMKAPTDPRRTKPTNSAVAFRWTNSAEVWGVAIQNPGDVDRPRIARLVSLWDALERAHILYPKAQTDKQLDRQVRAMRARSERTIAGIVPAEDAI